jgi:hypothetical protein
MTLSRIQELESLGFEWEWVICTTTWEDRLSELSDYRKIHGHCNVPKNYNENYKLANWVGKQRVQYALNAKGRRSQITPACIQALESLRFEWQSSIN